MSAPVDASPGLLPAGLGDKGGDYNRVFADTFEQIIPAGQDIRSVLDDGRVILDGLMKETGARCWAPDAPP